MVDLTAFYAKFIDALYCVAAARFMAGGFGLIDAKADV